MFFSNCRETGVKNVKAVKNRAVLPENWVENDTDSADIKK